MTKELKEAIELNKKTLELLKEVIELVKSVKNSWYWSYHNYQPYRPYVIYNKEPQLVDSPLQFAYTVPKGEFVSGMTVTGAVNAK